AQVTLAPRRGTATVTVPRGVRGMYRAMKRHEVHVLRNADHSTREIARATGLSRSTVKRVLKEPLIESPESRSPRTQHVGRPSTVEDFRRLICEILVAEPELLTVELLHRAKERGYRGGK